MTGNLYRKYWGKARSDKENGANYHLLAYHSLDVYSRQSNMRKMKQV